jgi:lipoprotein-releasing system permease protein
MRRLYEIFIGLTYVRAGRSGRRNGFISFISGVSMLGIALGVAALIIVLAVMNGFQKEVRDRMLAVVSHLDVMSIDGRELASPGPLLERIRAHPQVEAVAPYVAIGSLAGRGETLHPLLVRGIDVQAEPGVSALAASVRETVLARLQPGRRQIVLGAALAQQLGAQPGDAITLVLPRTDGGGGDALAPRLEVFTLLDTFSAGHYQYDSALAWLPLEDAMALLGVSGPTGAQVRLRDRDQAVEVGYELSGQLGPGVVVQDWTRTNQVWFESLRIQKRMFFLILALIVAVAAFNLVSTLVMTVTDKAADIAILRTLGATPRSIMSIFMLQGAASGVIGTAAGVVLGLAVALNVDVIVPAIERALGTRFLPASVYFIERMPSDPRLGDIVPIVAVSLALSFVATLYPSWRAGRIRPAEILRHE